MFHPRLGCSTISFRRQPLPDALGTIADAGFSEIDLGALPGVCDHVPYDLDQQSVDRVGAEIAASNLQVRSVNADVGDLNFPGDARAYRERSEHLDLLLSLTQRVGAKALVLPCGRLDRAPIRSLDEDLDTVAEALAHSASRASEAGVELWVEAPHHYRLCWNAERAGQLADRLAGSDVGLVMDFSHLVASVDSLDAYVDALGDRIAHVHLRDATEGNINLSIGNGDADFAAGLAALARCGYAGAYSLELETHDTPEQDRPAAAVRAAQYVTGLLSAH